MPTQYMVKESIHSLFPKLSLLCTHSNCKTFDPTNRKAKREPGPFWHVRNIRVDIVFHFTPIETHVYNCMYNYYASAGENGLQNADSLTVSTG